jgi:hypothetical protein
MICDENPSEEDTSQAGYFTDKFATEVIESQKLV